MKHLKEFHVPDDLPQADSYEIYSCGDPACGPHFILFNKRGEPIMEMVMSQKGARSTVDALQRMLYAKASGGEE